MPRVPRLALRTAQLRRRRGQSLQRLDEGTVGLEDVLSRQFLRRDPLQALAIVTGRFARVTLYDPQRKLDLPVAIVVRELKERTCLQHADADLLEQLSIERFAFAFARSDLAARELPPAGHMFARGAFGDEHTSVRVVQRGCDYAETTSAFRRPPSV